MRGITKVGCKCREGGSILVSIVWYFAGVSGAIGQRNTRAQAIEKNRKSKPEVGFIFRKFLRNNTAERNICVCPDIIGIYRWRQN